MPMSYLDSRMPAGALSPPRPSRVAQGYWRWCQVLLVLVMLQLFQPVWAAVTWQRVGAPDGGGVTALAVHPTDLNTAYAGSFSGEIFKSTNGGAIWVRVGTGLVAGKVEDIQIQKTAATTVFALVDGHLYKSADAGSTWTEMAGTAAMQDDRGYLRAIALDASSSTVYAMGYNALYKSADAGGSWQDIATSGITKGNTFQLAVSTVGSNELWLTNNAGIYKSTDGGSAWVLSRSMAQPVFHLAVVAGKIVAATDSELVYSVNNGTNWLALSAPDSSIYKLALNPSNSNEIYLSSYSAIYKSTNGGGAWTPLSGVDSSEAYVLAISPSSTNVVYIGGDTTGLKKSVNAGVAWSSINQGYANGPVDDLINDTQQENTLYALSRGQGWKSVDGGANWVAMAGGLPSAILSLSASKTIPMVLYASTEDVVYKSNNGGVNWTPGAPTPGVPFSGGSMNSPIVALGVSPNNSHIYAVTSLVGTYRSSNGGASWTHLSGSPSGTGIVVGTDAVYITTDESGIFKSINNGDSWAVANTGLKAVGPYFGYVTALAIDPRASHVLYLAMAPGSSNDDASLYQSTNAGGTWTAVGASFQPESNYQPYRTVMVDPNHSNTVYAAGQAANISRDAGASGLAFNAGLGTNYYNRLSAITTNPSKLYVGTSDGVYTVPIRTTISPATLPAAAAGAAYLQNLETVNGASPFVYTVTAGTLPPGLTLSANGVLSGTPSAQGTFNFTVKSTGLPTGMAPTEGSRAYTLEVGAATLVLSPTTLSDGRVLSAYSATIAVAGGVAPYSFTLASGTLPPGLSLTAGGVISGIPTQTGDYTFSVKATDSSNSTGSLAYTQSITAAPATAPGAPSSVTASAASGQATVSFAAAADGGAAITSYTVTSSPDGVMASGVASPITVSGLANGTVYTFRVTATNSVGTGSPSDPSNSVTPMASQTISFAAPGPQEFGTTTTLNASSSSGLPVGFSAGSPAVCAVTMDGLLSFVGTGMCTIQADQLGNAAFHAAPPVSHSFAVNAAVPGAPLMGSATAGDKQASVTFTAPVFTGGAALLGYTVTSSPSGISATGASSPIVVTGLVNGTAYTFAVTAINSAGPGIVSAASNSVTPKAEQTISFANPGAQNFGTAPALAASSSSGLVVSLSSSTPVVCSVVGGHLAFTSIGSCSISASQAGDAAYLPATAVVQTFAVHAVAPAAPTIGAATAGDKQATVTFTAPVVNGGDAVTGYTVTSSPGGLSATGTNSPIQVTGLANGTAYTFTVAATNSAGTGAASAASNSVTPKAEQSISFANPGAQNFGTTPALTASSTSGLAVSFSSNTPAVCSVVGGSLAFVSTGSCAINANQAGDAAYLPATAVVQAFAVNAVVAGAPTIGVATGGDKQATVAFTAPVNTGGAAVTGYTVTSVPGGIAATGSMSPIVVTGLTNGTAYTFKVAAINSAGTGAASDPSNSVTPTALLAVSTASLPNAQIAVAYSQSLMATGGSAPYTWTVNGTLPTGLSLAPNGAITGIPTQVTETPVTITVQVLDALGATANKDLTLSVSPANLSVQSALGDFSGLQVGKPFSLTLSADGGVAPYSWQASGLPSGLALTGSTLSGTPSTPGGYTLVLTVTDSSAVARSAVLASADISKAGPATATQTFTVTVASADLAISTSSLANAQEKAAYSHTLAAIGGTAPYHWQATGLPAGVSLDSATGILSGTATTQGNYAVVVTVTDSAATPATASTTLTLQVTAEGQTASPVPVPGLGPWAVALLGALLALLGTWRRSRASAA